MIDAAVYLRALGGSMRFVGLDPGGRMAFGWAVLLSTQSGLELLGSGTCDSASEAIQAVNRASGEDPVGVATDAPLFWVESGDRKADAFVRKLVCAAGGQSGTVSHINSLRGACLVQGVQATRLAMVQWPNARWAGS